MTKFKDITGEHFSDLTAVRFVGRNKHGAAMWECACNCGKFKVVPIHALTTGNTKSCGCRHKGNLKKDILGQTFGYLTVVEYAGKTSKGQAMWKCLCKCENEVVVLGSRLRNGHTQSCGCYQRERASQPMSPERYKKTMESLKYTHNTPEYLSSASRRSKKMWENPVYRDQIILANIAAHNTPEYKAAHSGKNASMYGKVTHGKGSWYTRRNGERVWMRSLYETRYAEYLDNLGSEWIHEPRAYPIVYTYKGITKEGTYTPDFLLGTGDLVEIKGYWRDDAKVKFEAFKEQYPDLNIKLLMEKDLINLGVNLKKKVEE